MTVIKSIIVVVSIFNLLFSWCDDLITSPETPEGRYAYKGYDSTGVKIVAGWLKIELADSVTVTGEWNFYKVGQPENIGPQIGSGSLIGSYEKGRLSLNLNPNMIDNNVVLNGDYSEKKFEGEWMYIGVMGVINRGTFKAVK